ncbi:hypothetical protein [Roseiconus lacunae]|uniref:DUF998 domain-containing protein n=1 Tax=Roseiconus lacunae TaxID=2605694 RepID=A0ABT7PPC5_9BACT|nr:hypothetical protein [Roseiconus lacunae]MDM4018320.1 hypothetical protein [Roseiconus lacunae]WRQ53644.1 hypothetical protein U8335_14215 [Stieleria sp. HD01]
MPESSPSQHHNHPLVLSYLGIRRAIGLSGLILPVVLGPLGWLILDVEIQDNMSSYYHTPLRDLFVGTLCAMGVFLYCYRGYGWIEDWTANIGSAAALGVALFPLDYASDPLYQRSLVGYLHSFSGGVFFLTLATYSLYHFPSRGHSDPEMANHIAERNLVYYTSGVVILLSMIAMGSYLLLLPVEWKRWLNDLNFLFWAEWVAVWAFAAAWLTKGHIIVAEIGIDLLAYSRRLVDR